MPKSSLCTCLTPSCILKNSSCIPTKISPSKLVSRPPQTGPRMCRGLARPWKFVVLGYHHRDAPHIHCLSDPWACHLMAALGRMQYLVVLIVPRYRPPQGAPCRPSHGHAFPSSAAVGPDAAVCWAGKASTVRFDRAELPVRPAISSALRLKSLEVLALHATLIELKYS